MIVIVNKLSQIWLQTVNANQKGDSRSMTCGCVLDPASMVMGKSWSVSNITGGRLATCHFWEGVLVLGGNSLARLTASSSDDVGRCVLSNRLFRAKNLAFLGFSQSLSSELPLVVPLAISDLALGRLGNALLLGGGGSGVEVFRIWLIHLSLLA